MTETKNTTITIVNNSRTLRVVQRSASILMAFVGPIALGTFLESFLLQLIGFLFGLLFLYAAVRDFKDKSTFHTVEQAKAHLDLLRINGEAP